MRHFLKSILLLTLVLFHSNTFAQKVNIKIVETTDVHGAIYPYNFQTGKKSAGSLSQVSTYLNDERSNKNQSVLLLDNGDILQGTPAVYYYNFENPNEKHLYARVMNYLKYDAGSVGNHDIETGHNVYDKFRKELDFNWLAANAIDVRTNKPYFEPYFVKTIKGIKIAVLGMITPAIPQWLPPDIFRNIEFEDMVETAKKWVPIIQQKEKPDILIGLFHSGVEYSYGGNTADTYRNENASQVVAERVPGFDVVFVGHDHHGWNKWVTNTAGKKVLILGATSSARNVAVADFQIEKGNPNPKILSGKIISMKNYQSDKKFLTTFHKEFEEVKNYVSQLLGVFTASISTGGALFGNSAFTDLINTAQLEIAGTDISFTAPLAFTTTIDSGEIYVGDMFALYRYENLLYTMKMTGQEVKDYLEYTAGLWFNQMKTKSDHLLRFKIDKNGKTIYSQRTKHPELFDRYYNFDAAAGIKYTVDISKPIGRRITIKSMEDGSAFDYKKVYKVAVNSYRGNGGGGHLVKGAKIPEAELRNRIIHSTEKDLRFLMMKWIKEKGTVSPKMIGNWEVIPADLWQAGKDRDYKIMIKK